jgi:hypothetical protein
MSGATPLELCDPTTKFMGVTSPATGTLQLSYLPSSFGQLPLNLPYTVTF